MTYLPTDPPRARLAARSAALGVVLALAVAMPARAGLQPVGHEVEASPDGATYHNPLHHSASVGDTGAFEP